MISIEQEGLILKAIANVSDLHAVEAAINEAEEKRCDIIEIEGNLNPEMMKQKGFFYRPRKVTYKMLVPNEKDYLKLLKRSRRKAIRKALKTTDIKITIEEPISPQTYSEWEKIYDSNISSKRVGYKRITIERFEKIRERSIGVFAWLDSKLVGGIFLRKKQFILRGKIHQKLSISLSSSKREHFRKGVNALLNYHVISYANKKGYKYLERGMDSNLYGNYLSAGLYVFKKSMGFRIAPRQKYGFAWTKIIDYSKLSDPIFFISQSEKGVEGNLFFKEMIPNVKEFQSNHLKKLNLAMVVNNEAMTYKTDKPINLLGEVISTTVSN